MKYNWYPWPYCEALRMDEAVNPLSFMVTGLYGKPLPRQNGAPIRIVNPWKYGYKSPKSIVKIEFIAKETEKIPDMELPETLPYNGYEKWVGHLYDGKES